MRISRLTYDIGCFPLDRELRIGKQDRFETGDRPICFGDTLLLPYLRDSRHTVAPRDHARIVIRDADILHVPLSDESRTYDQGVLEIYKKRFWNKHFRPAREEFNLKKDPVISLKPTKTKYGFFFPGIKHIVPTIRLGDGRFTLSLTDRMIDVLRL